MHSTREVTPDELAAAFTGPATYSNRFFVTVGPIVRIAFTEQRSPSDTPLFRNAVALTHEDAINLKNVLSSLLSEIEAQLAEFKASEEAAKAGKPGARP